MSENRENVRAGFLRPVIQVWSFVRKEILAVVRQPRLLLVLVVGPFLLLFLFGLGFDDQNTVLRTAFVGPEDSVYEDTIDKFSDQLEQYVIYSGYGTDLVEAQERLNEGDVDVIVVFPDSPAERVLEGEQAVITVLHNKLDPIQQTAVEVSAQVAVHELNAMVLEQTISDAKEVLEAADADFNQSSALVSRLQALTDRRLEDGEGQELQEMGEAVTELEPAMVVRPFRPDTENLLRERVTVNDFFAPAAIALLLQHMALTFAALGLVRDRSLGLFELFRVGPVGAGTILAGKSLAYFLLGGAVGAALLAAVVTIIGVPLRGDPIWITFGLLALVASSIGWGTILSLLARSDTQAVQFAMLALLAGLFFGGFLLDFDAIRFPVNLLSYLLPVTYSTRLFRDVMLRGIEPVWIDVVGPVAVSVVTVGIAWLLMRRRLRTE